jgi:hypothetical protein
MSYSRVETMWGILLISDSMCVCVCVCVCVQLHTYT